MKVCQLSNHACSWGIGAKVANDSMRSAAATLAEYASKGGQGDSEG